MLSLGAGPCAQEMAEARSTQQKYAPCVAMFGSVHGCAAAAEVISNGKCMSNFNQACNFNFDHMQMQLVSDALYTCFRGPQSTNRNLILSAAFSASTSSDRSAYLLMSASKADKGFWAFSYRLHSKQCMCRPVVLRATSGKLRSTTR